MRTPGYHACRDTAAAHRRAPMPGPTAATTFPTPPRDISTWDAPLWTFCRCRHVCHTCLLHLGHATHAHATPVLLPPHLRDTTRLPTTLGHCPAPHITAPHFTPPRCTFTTLPHTTTHHTHLPHTHHLRHYPHPCLPPSPFAGGPAGVSVVLDTDVVDVDRAVGRDTAHLLGRSGYNTYAGA